MRTVVLQSKSFLSRTVPRPSTSARPAGDTCREIAESSVFEVVTECRMCSTDDCSILFCAHESHDPNAIEISTTARKTVLQLALIYLSPASIYLLLRRKEHGLKLLVSIAILMMEEERASRGSLHLSSIVNTKQDQTVGEDIRRDGTPLGS